MKIKGEYIIVLTPDEFNLMELLLQKIEANRNFFKEDGGEEGIGQFYLEEDIILLLEKFNKNLTIMKYERKYR